jgi:hypothetical protein
MGERLPIAFQFMTKGVGYMHSVFNFRYPFVSGKKRDKIESFSFGIVMYDVLLCMCCSG